MSADEVTSLIVLRDLDAKADVILHNYLSGNKSYARNMLGDIPVGRRYFLALCLLGKITDTKQLTQLVDLIESVTK